MTRITTGEPAQDTAASVAMRDWLLRCLESYGQTPLAEPVTLRSGVAGTVEQAEAAYVTARAWLLWCLYTEREDAAGEWQQTQVEAGRLARALSAHHGTGVREVDAGLRERVDAAFKFLQDSGQESPAA